LVHWNVDDARVLNLVRSDASISSGLDSGLDNVMVALVEIEHATGLKVGFLSKTHDDEASWCWHGFPRVRIDVSAVLYEFLRNPPLRL
jgi:hypothetical protein